MIHTTFEKTRALHRITGIFCLFFFISFVSFGQQNDNFEQAQVANQTYSNQQEPSSKNFIQTNSAELNANSDSIINAKKTKNDIEISSINTNKQRTYLIIIFVLIVIFGILVFFDIKSKIKTNTKLRNVNHELELQKEELTRALEDLSKSETKYRNLIEHSPTGIIYLDKKGNILEINKKMIEILGSPGEEATKEINCLKYPPLQNIGLSDAILKSIETREVIFNEARYITKWGKKIDVRYYINPIINSKGKVSNLILNVEDVTLSKEFEKSKLQSELKYRILVENSLQAMLIIKKERLFFANARMEELSQYKFEELANHTNWLEMIIHPEDYERVSSTIKDALDSKKIPARNEYRYIRKDGEIRWMESIGSIVDYEGQPAILVVAIDTTERKEAESILVESEKQLRQANAMKDKFFSIIAHDLKNPFNAILGFSNLLFEAYDNFDDKQRKMFIRNICEASGNTFKLLQNLLEWSRTQTGKIEIIPEYVDITAAINENLMVMKTAAETKKININSYVSGPMIAYADKNMTKAIIRNLISNAIKFTNPGGKIEVKAIHADTNILVSVIDNGIGIDDENLRRLFRIDDQFKTKGTENEEGSGLGLILCKEFVEKNGGNIWVESTLGIGSTFSFTLPSGSEK